jgi:hypothetical protein
MLAGVGVVEEDRGRDGEVCVLCEVMLLWLLGSMD